jgi:UDP-N-acetylmuramoyl-tripeptide--D-alanyl-D-alanine ligase
MSSVISRIAACVVCACLFFIGTFKSLGALQQSGYRCGGFVRWLKRKDNLYYNRLALWSGLGFLSSAVFSLTFSFAGEQIALSLSALPFLLFCVLFCVADVKYALKVPVHKTPRLKRLSAVYILFIACVSFIVISLLDFIGAAIDSELYRLFRFTLFAFFPLLLPWLLVAANAACGLYETPHNKKFVKRAGQVLDEIQITRVAVVGSYGKTSVKNILKELLSAKYSVVATPESFNTPLGIAKTVTDENFKNNQIFIAEMGARHLGDVEELCELVKPNYALFTGVCAQHIETFGSEENVLKGKSEIFKSDVKLVVCGESLKEKLSQKLTEKEQEKALFAAYGSLISDLELYADHTKFLLCLPDLTPIPVDVPLLGKHSAENIALAALLAAKMGLNEQEIAKGIEKIKPIPHRLQLLENEGVYILDDSYNTNLVGAAEAIEALKRFSGRKIVVTPGIVETGILEEEIAVKLGGMLAGLDEVILVGETLVKGIKTGYLAAGGKEEQIVVLPTLEKAQNYLSPALQQGDCVLFLNDLPDVF